MNRVCRVATIVFLFVYLAALALFIIGTVGLFGQDRDPLSAVFLMPLGLPWNLMLDVFPEPLWPWLAAAVPALNLMILRSICAALASAK